VEESAVEYRSERSRVRLSVQRSGRCMVQALAAKESGGDALALCTDRGVAEKVAEEMLRRLDRIMETKDDLHAQVAELERLCGTADEWTAHGWSVEAGAN
jgi:creatinine amidohydrolase/Fe(II)-dependent formamide hydrolase-like protein